MPYGTFRPFAEDTQVEISHLGAGFVEGLNHQSLVLACYLMILRVGVVLWGIISVETITVDSFL